MMPPSNDELHTRVSVHEAVCAERYKAIEASITDLQAQIKTSAEGMQAQINAIQSTMKRVAWGVAGAFGGIAIELAKSFLS
jgi:phage-related tail protein